MQRPGLRKKVRVRVWSKQVLEGGEVGTHGCH
jgi:hypothetical protein